MDNLTFDELAFKRKLDAALKEVRRILDTSRHPELAADVHHGYGDKYCLSEYLTNAAMAALLNVLDAMGLDEEKLSVLVNWAREGRSVWLEYEAEESCEFLREQVREEKSKKKQVFQSQLLGRSSHQVVTTIKEYYYKVSLEYLLVARCSRKDSLVINSRKGDMEIKTASSEAPRPKQQTHGRKNASPDITFLLKQLTEKSQLAFAIDRTDAEECRTPVRNPDIEAAVKLFGELKNWGYFHGDHLKDLMGRWQNLGARDDKQPKEDLDLLKTDSVFVPVLPLFEKETPSSKSRGVDGERAACKILRSSQEESKVTFNLADTNILLDEQKRSIGQRIDSLAKAFKSDQGDSAGLITIWEAKMATCFYHCHDICQQYRLSIAYVEDMVHKQLVAAIGKEVTPKDFEKYMRYHEKRLFADEYGPLPFCYAIRRPGHYPEGTVAIENEDNDPIFALTRLVPAAESSPMKFKINAATNITFNGKRYLHAFVANKFKNQPGAALQVVAHARQFSCFMLLLGRIGPGNTFEPKSAILLENKDYLKIPIFLEQLPTPKEFKDAIKSLSPEQQSFAKAYRSMQLEGSVFGLLTIQLKPQLEKLLKLPDNSLTKEIKLTQDLLRLFIEYQIPSDLLSYEGDAEAELQVKLEAAKGHVKAIMDMIEDTKKEQLDQAAQEFVQQQLEKRYSSTSSSSDYGCDLYDEDRDGDALELDCTPEYFSRPEVMMLNKARPEVTRAIKDSPRRSIPPPKPQSTEASAPTPTKTDSIQKQDENKDAPNGDRSLEKTSLDFTKVPSRLDSKFEKLDTDSALRPTILNVGEKWEKRSLKSLRGKPIEKLLWPKEQGDEKTRCFDLLDALSCSGTLEIDCASLHVVVAATHCFDESIVNTIVRKNINPIEKMERSTLIVASTVHGKELRQLVKPAYVAPIGNHSPQLLNDADEAALE